MSGPREPGANLAAVIAAWSALFQQRSTEQLAALLDPDVIWQGLLPELVCTSRDEVLHLLDHFSRRLPHITRMEAEEFGDQVAVSVEGTGFPENE
ncbi:MAG TPA: nuclear transport factor 2 family protein, partial [Candidatus Dormibacteraeota bacterium]|nr:nuclear transport factor 2 family protein [Candidatus Dormibacteraeota bacterium]